MNILHIAHYDRFPRENTTFIGKAKNGLEKFLEILIINDHKNTHSVLYFNEYDNTIVVQQIDTSGSVQAYRYFEDIKFESEIIEKVVEQSIENFCIDCVHIHYSKEYVLTLSKYLNHRQKPTVISIHDEIYLKKDEQNTYIYSEEVANFFKYATRVIFPHKIIMNRYLNLYSKVLESKVRCISHGTNLSYNYKIYSKDYFKVLILGRINSDKGLDIVQNLQSKLSSKIKLQLLGKSEKQLLGVEDFGEYTNQNIVKKIRETEADCILIPSVVEESFSFVALEATAMGFPIICFPVGALQNIEEECRGFVAKERTEDALIQCIEEVYIRFKNTTLWSEDISKIKKIIPTTELEMTQKYEEEYYSYVHQNSGKSSLFHEIDYQFLLKESLCYIKTKESELYKMSKRILSEQIIKNNELRNNEVNFIQERAGYYEQIQNSEEQNYVKKGVFSKMKRLSRYVRNQGGFIPATRKIANVLKRDGAKGTYYRFRNRDMYDKLYYKRWLERNEQSYTQKEVNDYLSKLSYQPKFSFLIPVYNVEEKYLRECIDSIRKQQYKNWELCIADDKSTATHIRPLLEEYMRLDKRIRVVFREENGHISAATNSALEIATGEFIALVDNDDYIRETALFEVVKLMNCYEHVDMVYTDEDKVDAEGQYRLSPFFKPDWSPDAFWGHMYLCHLGIYRTEIARRIGGFRIGYEGSQDYDFALRFTEQTKNIYHVPKILYHWRMIPTSTAASADNKDYAYDASLRAKKSAIERRGYNAVIEEDMHKRSTNVRFNLEEDDFISIIIPTKDHTDLVERCISSIHRLSLYRNFEVILIDNGSTEESKNYFNEMEQRYSFLRILELPIPFNYSHLNNEGVKVAQGNLLLFLNNDIEVITGDFLERMGGQAKLPYTGAVGATLYYPNCQVQHAGILSLNNSPVHAFHNFYRGELGYFGRLSLTYNYLAVTGAALMIEKSKFLEVNGFTEELSISYNDVDLGLKLYDKGYFNSVRGDVEFFHFESQTRGYDIGEKKERMEKEKSYLNNKWSKYLEHDPFYNENLTQEKVDFTLK